MKLNPTIFSQSGIKIHVLDQEMKSFERMVYYNSSLFIEDSILIEKTSSVDCVSCTNKIQNNNKKKFSMKKNKKKIEM